MAKTSTANKSSAAKKKATAKKAAPAKKNASAKKAPAKTTTAKKTPAKKAAPKTAAKKAPAKKAPAKKRPAKLDAFATAQKAALLEERAEYTRNADRLQAEADQLAEEREPGDVQFDEESGEGDTLAVERERDLALSAQAAAAVEEIDIALGKIKEGTYGVCEQCHNTIPKERLRALPYAALCVQCKSAGFTRR
jgi:DnaK suppressor protein